MKVLLAMLLLLTSNGPTRAQSRRPVVFSTPTQAVTLTLRPPNAAQTVAKARVTYTVTAANVNDTLTGTLNITFPDNPGKKTAKRPLMELPRPVSEANVVASFRKQTACPQIKIEIGPLELPLNGTAVVVDPFELVLNETKDEMSQLLCFWTKQINTTGLRRGIVARINRLINGDDQTP